MNPIDDLVALEPVFHRPEAGTDVESMIAEDFWEIGASGRTYSRAHALQVLAERAGNPGEDRWETSGFQCRELAPDLYLLTYTLRQDRRVTRRASLWRRTGATWKIAFHQGTIVQEQGG